MSLTSRLVAMLERVVGHSEPPPHEMPSIPPPPRVPRFGSSSPPPRARKAPPPLPHATPTPTAPYGTGTFGDTDRCGPPVPFDSDADET